MGERNEWQLWTLAVVWEKGASGLAVGGRKGSWDRQLNKD